MELAWYDVVIVGAGPGGAATALSLEHSGLRVALLDKHTFPRDKVCGDLVAGKGLRALGRISPKAHQRVMSFTHRATVKSTALYVGHPHPWMFKWVIPSAVIKRFDFDHILVEEAASLAHVHLMTSFYVKQLQRIEGGFEVRSKEGQVVRGRLLVGADGAHSVVSKTLANYTVDKEHYGGSVRAYFEGVSNIQSSVNEIYIDKAVMPGYFWLFPLSDNSANVGIGMHSRHIAKKQVDLKKLFYDFISSSAVLKSKLGNARQVGRLEGFGLPFYSKEYSIHGDGFLLVGDAASLVDPSNGEGILLALESGEMAAKHIRRAFEHNNFSAHNLEGYFMEVSAKWWKEMRRKAWFVNTFGHRVGLLPLVSWAGQKSQGLQRFVQKRL
jgi:geranylgeranyl reductase family protein